MRLFNGIREYLRVPRGDRRIRQDIADELQLHIELRSAELERQGMTSIDARRTALEQFGDLADAEHFGLVAGRRAEDRQRWQSMVDELQQDARIAWRQLSRHLAFSTTAVTTLALAIGTTTAMYAAVHTYLIRPLPYPNSDRLYEVITAPTRERFPNAPNLRDVDWTPVQREFAGSLSWDLDGFTVAGGERPTAALGAWVTQTYFSTLGLATQLGRTFRPDEYLQGAPAVALISHRLFMQHFGGRNDIVGSSVRLYSTDRPQETEIVTIAGVLPPDAWHINRFTDVLRPLSTSRMPYVLPLPAGMTPAQAEERLNALVRPQLSGDVDPAWRMSLYSLQDQYTQRVRPVLLSLLGAAVFVLLIAGASVAGTLVARAVARQGELQLRAALGASRGRLLRQLLTESLVLAAQAATLGGALAWILLRAGERHLPSWLGARIPSATGSLDTGWLLMALAVAACALVCVAFGLLPAWIVSRRSIAGGVRRAGHGSGASLGPVLRRILIGAQVACTMVLLSGAALLGGSVYSLGMSPLGFRPDGVTTAQLLLPESRYPDSVSQLQFVARLTETLESDPAIATFAVASGVPFGRGGLPVPVSVNGGEQDRAEPPRAALMVVTPGYFTALGISLLNGRAFAERDGAAAPPTTVISASMARLLFGEQDAIGRQIVIGATDGRSKQERVALSIIGIVSNTRKPVSDEALPDVYLPFAQYPQGFVTVVARGARSPAIGEIMRRRLATVDDALALEELTTLSDLVANDSATHRVLAGLLTSFGIFALALTLLGLYGALSYIVAQRRRELAVRAAVGASGSSILRHVLREGSRTTVVGLIAGAVLSLWLKQVLASRIDGLSGGGVLEILAVACVLLIASLGALAIPARRASGIDPASALRGE